MTRLALTTADSPQKAASKASNQKDKKSQDSVEILKSSVSGKAFKNMNASDKDELLELLALKAGVIEPE